MGRFFLFAVLASLAAGGCLGQGSAPSSDPASPLPAGSAVGSFLFHLDGRPVDVSMVPGLPPLRAVQRFTGGTAYEPTIGVTAEGHLFVSAGEMVDYVPSPPSPYAVRRSVPLIRASSDEGATWRVVNPRLPTGDALPPLTSDPFVHVDASTGRVYSSDLQAQVCSSLMWSDDEGQTWVYNPVGCGHPLGAGLYFHDHQMITTGKPRTLPTVGYPNVVYYCINRLVYAECAASPNGGYAFGPMVRVNDPCDLEDSAPSACPCDGDLNGLNGATGHVRTDAEGRVLVPMVHCGHPTVFVSEDDGLTWKKHVISSASKMRGHDVSMAADAAGNLHALWIDQDTQTHYAHSLDHGATWSPARRVSLPFLTATDFMALDAGATGQVAFAYLGTDHPGGRQDPAMEGSRWDAFIGVIPDALGEDPVVMTARANPEDDAVARNACTSEPGEPGDRCDGMADFVSLRIDPNGRPWAAMVDVCNEACAVTGRNDRALGNGTGFVATLDAGPALVAEGGLLRPLMAANGANSKSSLS